MGELGNTREGLKEGPCSTCGTFEGRSNILGAWEKKGFTHIPIELSPQQIQAAVNSFMTFNTLPEEVRKSIATFLPGDERRVDLGFGSRNPKTDGDGEHKEFFHYHPDILKKFEHEIKSAEPAALSFMAEADKIWLAVAKQVKKIIEEEFVPIYGANIAQRFIPDEKGHPRVTLRFLSYKSSDDADYSAQAHIDRGTMTIALAESAPGLWVEDKVTGEHTPIQHTEGQGIFFPGYGFNYNVDPRIKPTLHGVDQSKGDNYSEDVVRWALVAFIDIPGTKTPSKDETVNLNRI